MHALVTLLYVILTLRLKIVTGSSSQILQVENIFENIENLTVDLMYKTRGDHCYAIVTDRIYQSILSTNLFTSVSQSTYLIIFVPDFADTLRPEPIFLLSLLQAQHSGCRTFLIYLANGIQMERFLRFVDQFRVLDTRSKFIFLHDYRLFSKRLHYLWKRIVNVIFVKENDYSHRGNLSTGTWFELTTVPFPLPIKEVYVDKKLDSWRSGKYQRGAKLFENKLNNLNGEKMKAAVFRHRPGVSGVSGDAENRTAFAGVEVEFGDCPAKDPFLCQQILDTMASAMNFSLQFYESDDTENAKWGRLQSNGSASGLLGEMINRRADFAIGDLHYTPHHLNVMDLSVPYTSQCLTFLTPESLTDNSWKTLVLPFSVGMWLGVLFFLFSVGIVFYVLGQIHIRLRRKDTLVKKKKYVKTSKHIKRTSTTSETISMQIKILPKRTRRTVSHKDIFESFGNCILYTYSMLLVVSLPRFPKSWSIRVLTGWYWIYCILVVVAYRASLTAILAKSAPRVTIDTLQQLAESPIGCGAWGEQNKQFFLESLDEAGQKIGAKLEDINDMTQAIERVARGKYAYYENEYTLREMRSKRDTNSDPHPLHIMKECAVNMPISIGLEKNSPLKPRFDLLLRRLFEAGLVSKWLSEAVRNYEYVVDEPEDALMDLKKMYGAFVALGIGYFISVVALFGEVIYWKCVVVKSPLYDEYALYKLYE